MPTWETTYVSSTDGVEVAVHDFGGDGRPLLLCHATGFCGLTWLPMVEALLGPEALPVRLLALDFRAHGQTRLPAGAGLAWSAMADDLTAVIEAVSPGEPVWAVGHSMGGSAIHPGRDDPARPGGTGLDL